LLLYTTPSDLIFLAVMTTLTSLLPSGLTLILEHVPSSQSAACGFFVKTGSRDETDLESGVSHFLEHMAFKGTEKRTAFEIGYELSALGVQANAFTSEEVTAYYGATPMATLNGYIELLGDMVCPAIRDEDFELEKKVILEEIALYKDRPQRYLFEQALLSFYNSHPAGSSVLGSTESVSALTPAVMRAYYESRYAASNAAVVVTGNFDPARCRDDIERVFSYFVPCPKRARTYQERVLPCSKSEILERKGLQQSTILFLAPGCSHSDPLRHAQSVLLTALGDSSGSRLYWDLVYSGLVESVDMGNDPRDEVGSMYTFMSTEPSHVEQVSDVFSKHMALGKPLTSDEIERAKNKLLSSLAFQSETPMGRLYSLGLEWCYGNEPASLERLLAPLRAVDQKQISEVLEKYPLSSWHRYMMNPSIE
jgi:predicted Zn-dependent peptidase